MENRNSCCDICMPCCCQCTGQQSFASFVAFAILMENNTQIPFVEQVPDTTEKILLSELGVVTLSPGYYLISYQVSALLPTGGYVQITPSYNGRPHIENGIYFMTGTTTRSSAAGSAFLIVEAAETTTFSLNYIGNATATEGNLTMTILKLERL